jgi:nucleoid-associated protein YgaU
MTKNILMVLFILSLTASCGALKKKKQGPDQSLSSSSSEAENSGDDELDNLDDLDDLDELEDGQAKNSQAANTQKEEKIDDDLDDLDDELEDGPVAEESRPAEPVEEKMAMSINKHSGDKGHYTVQKGDTLMLIAFKLYGDYGRWSELASMNRDKIGKWGMIRPGHQIRYAVPNQPFQWMPKGSPYMIQRGDTLGTISESNYGTTNRWKDLWYNNRPMIKDPNLIFAGFTLYVPSDKMAQY